MHIAPAWRQYEPVAHAQECSGGPRFVGTLARVRSASVREPCTLACLAGPLEERDAAREGDRHEMFRHTTHDAVAKAGSHESIYTHETRLPTNVAVMKARPRLTALQGTQTGAASIFARKSANGRCRRSLPS
jgi:hypothetical protein